MLHILFWIFNAAPAALFAAMNSAAQGQARAVSLNGAAKNSSNPAAAGLSMRLTGTEPADRLPPDGEAPGAEIPVSRVPASLLSGSAEAFLLPNPVASPDLPESGVQRERVTAPQLGADGLDGFAVICRSTAGNNSPAGSTRSGILRAAAIQR